VCAGQRPARRDPIAFGDLLVDDEAQVREQLAIERDRLAGTFRPVVLEGVDVVDELRVIHVGEPARFLPEQTSSSARRAVSVCVD
jgi:hypothetical protein